jgi:hypothetical protein
VPPVDPVFVLLVLVLLVLAPVGLPPPQAASDTMSAIQAALAAKNNERFLCLAIIAQIPPLLDHSQFVALLKRFLALLCRFLLSR